MIDSLTGLRFFLVMAIVLGHFVQFGTSVPWLLDFLKQHNLIVGSFFALSGFVLSIGHKNRSPQSLIRFLRTRLSRVYVSYILVLLLFSPMFIYIERSVGATNLEIAGHALIVFALLQAWNPDWGLLWNSPTWFLSAWVFANALFPKTYAFFRRSSKQTLFLVLFSIFATLLLVRLIYSAKIGFWGFEESRADLDWNLFNLVRFSPILNSLEFLAGVLVGMLFTRVALAPSFSSVYSSIYFTLLFLIMVLRLWYPVNDMLSRTLFIPLFLAWVYYLSFQKGALSSFLKSPVLVYLGNLSFSIFIVHGALGQLFYKRAVRSWLGHEAPSFIVYLIVLLLASMLLYHAVERLKGRPSFRGSRLGSFRGR